MHTLCLAGGHKSRGERFVSSTVRMVDHLLERQCSGGTTPLPVRLPLLAFLRSGTLDLRYGSRRVLVDPTQVMLLNHGTPYTLRLTERTSRCCLTTLQLEPGAIATISAALGLAVVPVAPFEVPLIAASPDLAYALHVLLAATRSGIACERETLQAARKSARLIVALSLRQSRGSEEGPSSCLKLSEMARRARELIVNHAPERASLTEIAATLGTSRFHVCRTFSSEVGMTARQYLQRLRISEALYRLAEGERDLTALALDLGYSSHSHLTSVFRRLVGRPPSRLWAYSREQSGAIPSRILGLEAGLMGAAQHRIASA